MAENMIKFLRGNVANLPQTATPGALYFTKDEGVYLGLENGSYHRYGDFIIVADVNSLPTTGAHETCMYYCTSENILARYDSVKGWIQINKQPTAEELKVLLGLGTLAYKSEVAEADLNADLAAKINASTAANHVHDNKTVLDGITAEKVAAWDAAEGNAKAHADSLNTAMNTRVEALEAVDHTHANKALLDTYTQTEANLADAVAKKHSHTFNETELNKIVEGDVAKWNGVAADHLTSADKTTLESAIKDAKKAGTDANTNIETYKVANDARVLAVEEDIAEIVNAENGILAQAKSYSDGKLATARTEITAEIDADVKVVNDAFEAYKTSNDAALAGVKATAEAAATKTYTDEELAKKVDKVTGKSLIADTEITRLAGMSDGANKVEASENNGYIKIDGVETAVYTHPAKHNITDIEGLQEALDGKQGSGDFAAENHKHTKEDITDFAHTHIAAEITDLDATIKAYDYATKTEAQGYADELNVAMSTRVEALEAIDHDHENKDVLDGITAEKIAIWDAAETNVQADWSQNDEAADDYIKNRTHYVNVTETKVVDNWELRDGGGAMAQHTRFRVLENDRFVATLDDAEYRCAVRANDNGELELVWDDCEPILGLQYNTNMKCYTLAPAAPSNVGGTIYNLTVYRESVVTLDEKFIPDTIARTADVDAATSRIDGLCEEHGTAISELKELVGTKNVATAISEAVTAEADRAKGVEAGLRTDVDAVKADYLKAADKTELEGKITAEADRAKGIESGLRTDVDVIKADYLKVADKTELSDAIVAEKERAEAAEADLQTQINTIMNNPDTEGVINSINEFTQYIADHGEIAEGFRTGIDANAKAIEDHETLAAQTYETKEDATAKYDELAALVGEKAVQADWNQNDETAADHIKNRPFYEDVIVENVYSGSVNGTADDMYNNVYYVDLNEFFVINVDDKYIVEYDEQKYSLIPYEDEYGYVCIGAQANNPTDEIPFIIYANPDSDSGLPYIAIMDEEVHTLEIGVERTGVKKLDAKFLPDEARSDWNQNDPTAINYIENRPFYEVERESELVFERSITTEEYTFDGHSIYEVLYKDPETDLFEIDQLYDVVLDGKTYSVKGKLNGPSCELGPRDANDNYFDYFENVPFNILYIDYYGKSIKCQFPDNNPHTVQIYRVSNPGAIVQIDDKFISDNIARVTDVDAVSTALTQYQEAHAGDYTNAQIDEKVQAVSDVVAALDDTYATDDELAAAIAATKTDASNKDAVVLAEAQAYADQAEADAVAAAEGKVNALAGNVYTKEQTYTQAEVDALLTAAQSWGEF